MNEIECRYFWDELEKSKLVGETFELTFKKEYFDNAVLMVDYFLPPIELN